MPPLTPELPKALTESERTFSHYIKLLCLVIIATAVVYTAMDQLEKILVPFVLAVALSYLLTPLVNVLSCKECPGCWCRVPRGCAVLLAFIFGVLMLCGVGFILLRAVTTFTERKDLYRERIEFLLQQVFTFIERYNAEAFRNMVSETYRNHSYVEEASQMVNAFLGEVSITKLIGDLLGTAAMVVEDIM